MSDPGRTGVAGAGTMGEGIAQAFAQSGSHVTLVDADRRVARAAASRIATRLDRGVQRGRWSTEHAEEVMARVSVHHELEALAGCAAVIEAVPERLDLKRRVLSALAACCDPETILASNTSSLLISAIAAEIPDPERVVGLHFFNPAPIMRLVEVVPGVKTSASTTVRAVELVRALGKEPVVAADVIGFVVNRCARPFYGEALTLLAEGASDPAQVDRICRRAGFRMGPLELIDLIGVDVNLAIARSFHEQSFGEPRWRPSPMQARLVAAGLLGRKTGEGFHRYDDRGERVDAEPRLPAAPAARARDRTIVIRGEGRTGDALRGACSSAGFAVADRATDPWMTVDCDERRRAASAPGPHAVLCAGSSLAGHRRPGAAGFFLLPPAHAGGVAEITTDAATTAESVACITTLLHALGLHTERVGDGPGLVLGRIVAMLVNEAAFALDEQVATPEDIDTGMRLGLNFPHGPIEWGRELGAEHVRAILDGLWMERRDPRYRCAARLMRDEPFGRV
jgi:3-hydroxybutyryl-CoA dehydrogenase